MHNFFSHIPNAITQHIWHKLTLAALTTACVFSPMWARVLAGFGLTATFFNLFNKISKEKDFFDAIEKHQFKRFRNLLRDDPYLLNATDAKGYSSLHRAIKKYNPASAHDCNAIIDELISNGVNLYDRDEKYGRTVLHWAYYSGYPNKDKLGEQDTQALDFFDLRPANVSHAPKKILLQF